MAYRYYPKCKVETKMKKSTYNNIIVALAVMILECIAIEGAMPAGFFDYRYRDGGQWPVIGFMLLVVGGTLFYTRHQTKTYQISVVMLIVGLLLFTIASLVEIR